MRWWDFKALCGDTSDNIPGLVRGVGKKTAVQLLDEYGSLDGIYAHLEEITGRARKPLEEHKDEAYLSQELARIVTDLDMPLDLDQARIDRFNPQAVEDLFRELEFRNLTRELNSLVGKMNPVISKDAQLGLFADEGNVQQDEDSSPGIKTVLVDTTESLAALEKTLSQSAMIAFDTETTDTDVMRAKAGRHFTGG